MPHRAFITNTGEKTLKKRLGELIEHSGMLKFLERFILNEQIQIQQDFRSGVWVCEFEPLGIIGYGKSRHDALTAFRMDFSECWENIAQEEDKNLTLDALELKQKLHNLVQYD